MNNPELLILLIIGCLLMCIPIAIQMKWYRIAAWKSVVVSLVLVITGVVGSSIWFYIENGYFEGRSFYGAIFFSPLVYVPTALILQVPYGKIMDFVAPAGCLTLALVKIQCFRDRCCEGFVIGMTKDRVYINFPSQIVEMAVFLVISGILFWMSSKEKYRTKIFPWFLLQYGASRFFLDFLREKRAIYALGLTAGSFWSLIAFVTGAVVLTIMKKKNGTVND